MKNAIILHGMPDKEHYFDPNGPSSSNSQWYPWIQQQLTINGISAQTPEMPDSYQPNYKKWSEVFEQFKIDEKSILIGHSCGAGFLTRWLSENKVKFGKLILVAPWMDAEDEFKNEITDFFDFQIDPDLINRGNEISILYSTDDYSDVVKTVEIIKEALSSINIIKFENKGHFDFVDMKTGEFPELLEEVLR